MSDDARDKVRLIIFFDFEATRWGRLREVLGLPACSSPSEPVVMVLVLGVQQQQEERTQGAEEQAINDRRPSLVRNGDQKEKKRKEKQGLCILGKSVGK